MVYEGYVLLNYRRIRARTAAQIAFRSYRVIRTQPMIGVVYVVGRVIWLSRVSDCQERVAGKFASSASCSCRFEGKIPSGETLKAGRAGEHPSLISG